MGIRLARDSRFEVGWLVWQARPPKPSLTIVVKATFAIDPERGTCVVADAQEPLTGDVHQDGDPQHSVRFESDLAVFKPRGEWVLAGTCHPPGGSARVSAVSVRVGAARKDLAVFGDRVPAMLGGASEPEPFRAMSLAWERAFGGAGFADNPFGRGRAPTETAAGAKVLWPNLQAADRPAAGSKPREEAVSFGPLPRGARVRRRRLGTYDRAWKQERWPYFPADFDFEHFVAAPEDQRIEGYFRGDEELELLNLHPRHAVVRARLPGLRPRIFLRRATPPSPASPAPAGAPSPASLEEVVLRLDTLAIDADAMHVMATWRGLVEIADERASDVDAIHCFDEPIDAELPAAHHVRRIAEGEAASRTRALADRAGEEPPRASRTSIEAGALRPRGAAAPPSGEALAALLAPALVRGSQPLAGAERPPPLAGRDLSGVELGGADLRNADLRGVVLVGARLGDARLDGARLDGAQLSQAYLSRASLRGASLVGADLTGARARKASFVDATLTRATLHETDLASAALDGANLERAELVGARAADATFVGARLDGADLRRAFLGRARFDGASLVGATLEGAGAPSASFVGAKLGRLKAAGAVLPKASLVRADAAAAVLTGAILDEADLSYAMLERAELSGASLERAVVHGTRLRNARLIEARLARAVVLKSDLMEAVLEGADLRGADLRGSNLFGAQLWRASTDEALLDLALLGRTHLAGTP